MHVSKYLSLLQRSEQLLAEAFMLVADRHSQDAEIREGARLLSTWSRDTAGRLKPFLERYGRRPALEPERVRDALFHDPRVGGLGLLRDVQDLLVLAQQVHGYWTGVSHAAMALKDEALIRAGEELGRRTHRQIAWCRTHLELLAPQALVVPAEKGSELRASVPLAPAPAALPDLAWAPLAAGLLLLVVGLIGVLFRNPWLLPSLGPSAYLIAENAAHPSSRLYNVVVGHLVGLGAGFAAVALLGAWDAPVVLAERTLVSERVFAAALAMLLTVLFAVVLRASHPPAGATTLLVALGSLSSFADAVNLMVGVALLALFGVGLRRIRVGRFRWRAEAAIAATLPRAPEPAR